MRFFSIVKDALLAPLRMAMDPWKAMHGQAGGLAQLSVAGTAGVITFILMFAVAIAAFIAVWMTEDVDWQKWWVYFLAAILLAIFTPIFVYYAVRFWTQEAGERFPDIENSWRQGVEELARRGLDLNRTPLYLVLGSESSLKDQYLMAASEMPLEISHFPRDRGAPLRWYAGEDAIFVVLTHVGCLTDLARAAAALTTRERVQVPVSGPSNSVAASATCWPTEDESFIAADDSSIRFRGTGPAPSNEVGYAGTLNLEDSGVMSFSATATEKAAGRKQPPKLSTPNRETTELERRRLAFLCRLVRASRYPFCPINGVLLLLPLNLILADERDGALTQNAVQTDIAVLMHQYRMRFPVAVLSTGWDEDLGFQEFVRRLGMEKAHHNRFGKGFGVGDPPLKDQLGAMCIQSCRAFEDWIYKLFREPNALSKPGNRALYGLLCKVRRYLQPRLDRIVAEGLGCDEPEQQDELPLMAGCYFVAAGSHEDTRAFVVKSFRRLYEETSEDLEWLPAAERASGFCYLVGYVSLALAGLLVLGAIAALFFWPESLGAG